MTRYLTEKEAVMITGFSKYWFRQKRCTGGGPPFIKVNGRAIRYPEDELHCWLRSFGIQQHTSDTPQRQSTYPGARTDGS